MAFSITLDHSGLSNKKYHSQGEVVIGGFMETFRSSLIAWNVGQYQNHWYQSIDRILNGAEKSALITDFPELSNANFLTWWPMWSEAGIIYFQDQLLFLNELSEPFELSRYWDFVPERTDVNEEGTRISQWQVTLQDLAIFQANSTDFKK